MAVSVVSFSFSRAAQPEAQSTLCWVMAFFTASYQHLLWTPIHQGPKPLRPGVAFPTTSHLQLYCNWPSNSTTQYNSSTPTWSPTRSLKSHVWSSPSGNNCHAVHRSLSSGATVYECTMGFFCLSHFVSQFPPTRFPLLTANGMCHFLPVHHLERHFGPGRRLKYNTSYALNNTITVFLQGWYTNKQRNKKNQLYSIKYSYLIQIISSLLYISKCCSLILIIYTQFCVGVSSWCYG